MGTHQIQWRGLRSTQMGHILVELAKLKVCSMSSVSGLRPGYLAGLRRDRNTLYKTYKQAIGAFIRISLTDCDTSLIP